MPQASMIAAAAVAVPFAAAALVGVLHVLGARDRAPAGVALLASIASCVLVFSLWWAEPAGTLWRVEWIPTLGIGFGFWADGLGRSFAALVAGLAVLTTLYSTLFIPLSREGRGRSSASAYHAYLLLLIGSALGLAFSPDLIQLYLFWELIDVAIFLLVGLSWQDRGAKRSAGVVLLFTTLGGLLLLLGLVILGTAAGGFGIPELVERSADLRAAPLFPLALVLVIAGAAIKSAQFPFHVWLPYAMAAPTPVNALADGAAALGAGVFLLLRLTPVLGGEPLWGPALVAIGLGSTLAGGVLAARAADLKILLAYSTVSQYGLIFAVVGFGGDAVLTTASFLLVQHGIIKAGLFFLVGTVGAGSGIWRVEAAPPRLWRSLPATAAIAALLALSLAGFPPLGGFWLKELFLHDAIESVPPVVVAVAVLGAALTVVYVFRFFHSVFVAGGERAVQSPVRVPSGLALVPGVLAVTTLALGARPGLLANALRPVSPPAWMIGEIDLSLGLGPALYLSVAALALGLLLFLAMLRAEPRLPRPKLSLTSLYMETAAGMIGLGRRVLGLQNGALLRYLSMILVASFGLVAVAVLGGAHELVPAAGPASVAPPLDWRAAPLLVLVCAMSAMTFLVRSHLHMVLSLGATGFLIAGLFGFAFAPSLGLLQVHVETLVTVLLILPLVRIPSEVRERVFARPSERLGFGRVTIAAVAGVTGGWVSWLAIEHLPRDPIAPWFTRHGQELTGADDLVAAVLLHFRALDTLGEIVVFATATAGVLAIGHLMRQESRDR